LQFPNRKLPKMTLTRGLSPVAYTLGYDAECQNFE
jgi:hypothetical protein